MLQSINFLYILLFMKHFLMLQPWWRLPNRAILVYYLTAFVMLLNCMFSDSSTLLEEQIRDISFQGVFHKLISSCWPLDEATLEIIFSSNYVSWVGTVHVAVLLSELSVKCKLLQCKRVSVVWISPVCPVLVLCFLSFIYPYIWGFPSTGCWLLTTELHRML